MLEGVLASKLEVTESRLVKVKGGGVELVEGGSI
jgi:hypothetical protein